MSCHARVVFCCHAQGAAEGFKYGFGLVVGVTTSEVVDVQGHHAVVDDAVEEFFKQVNVKTSDEGAGEVDVVDEFGAAGEVDDNAAQGFVKRNVGMAVAADTGFVAQGLFQGLTEYDTDVFYGVVVVDCLLYTSPSPRDRG